MLCVTPSSPCLPLPLHALLGILYHRKVTRGGLRGLRLAGGGSSVCPVPPSHTWHPTPLPIALHVGGSDAGSVCGHIACAHMHSCGGARGLFLAMWALICLDLGSFLWA